MLCAYHVVLIYLFLLRISLLCFTLCSSRTIPVKDSVLSMIASGDIRHMEKLLDHVDLLSYGPHLKNKHIALTEFKNFVEQRNYNHFLLPCSTIGKSIYS